jgi:hypothetical protein
MMLSSCTSSIDVLKTMARKLCIETNRSHSIKSINFNHPMKTERDKHKWDHQALNL